MSKPFDATTKHLVEAHPADWFACFGLAVGDVTVIDADLATVTAEADRVLRIGGETPWLAHVAFQSGSDRGMGERLLWYNALLSHRHLLPVLSIVVLLRPEADSPEITGVLRRFLPDGRRYLEFEYQVERIWRKPSGNLLAGGLGTLPMAPLADVSREELSEVIRRMKTRIADEATAVEAGMLWTATYVLMGLRYPNRITDPLLQGVREMKESTTYQAIVEEGRVEGRIQGRAEGAPAELRAVLLRLGTKRFGAPTVDTKAAIERLTSVETLEQLTERALDVPNWDELPAGA